MTAISGSIRSWTTRIRENNFKLGWRKEGVQRSPEELLILLTTEIVETYEEWRNGRLINEIYFRRKNGTESKVPFDVGSPVLHKPEGIPIELADIMIRLLDTCDEWGIDIEEAMELKMAYNKTRGFRHGGKRT